MKLEPVADFGATLAESVRIGLDVTAAITQGGGIGRFTRELVQALLEVDSHNIYHLFSAKPPRVTPVPEPLPRAPNVRYHPAPFGERWLYRLWYRFRLPLPLQWMTGPLDLFHSPDFVLPPVSRNVPTLLTVHDLSFAHYPQTFPVALVEYLNAVVPWSIRRATHVLADSLSTRNDLIEGWQVPEDKITVLYGGVNEQFRPITDRSQIAAIRSRYVLGTNPYVLTVGTLQPRKNYQMLIRAFSSVATKAPHNLVIAGGRGWLYDEMLAEVDKQGLAGRVKFVGFVRDEDLPGLYSEATMFLFPSLYEGFGLPLLEAMACGVPVISSNASSLPEVVRGPEGQDAALLLSPYDQSAWSHAIGQLIDDVDRRAEMIQQGLQQCSRFSNSWAARVIDRPASVSRLAACLRIRLALHPYINRLPSRRSNHALVSSPPGAP
jgi:glycosyltransferase involved in cell wall biosynthesis